MTASLSVEHDVANRGIGVAEPVVPHEDRSLVKTLVAIVRVASFFMGIAHPVKKVNHTVLNVDDFDARWVEIVGHVLISADAHKAVVETEDGGSNRALLEITPNFV